jgi:beta-lactamase regulating signal transducer with metallopeptidase domain
MSTFATFSINAWSHSWLQNIITASWQGGLFILVAWGVCRLFQRMPAAGKTWVWRLACLKLIVGLLYVVPLTLRILPAHSDERRIQQEERGKAQEESPNTQHITPNTQILSGLELETRNSKIGASLPNAQHLTPNAGGLKPYTLSPKPYTPLVPADYLFCAWLLVVAYRLARAARQALSARTMVRSARPVTDARLQEIADEIALAFGLRRTPPLRTSSQTSGPLITGLLRPIILLPENAAADFSESETRMALAHEMAHLRRGDLLFSVIPTLARTLFFFHPLVWWASRESRLAMEEACDEAALRVTGAGAADYGQLLLKFATSSGGRSAAVLGVSAGYRTLERRLKMLQQVSHRARSARFTTPLILIGATAFVLPWKVTAQQAGDTVRPVIAGQSATVSTLRATKAVQAGDTATITSAEASAPALAVVSKITSGATIGAKVVTAHIPATSLSNALTILSKSANVKYSMDPAVKVAAAWPVNAQEINHKSLDAALIAVLASASTKGAPLSYQEKGNTIYVVPKNWSRQAIAAATIASNGNATHFGKAAITTLTTATGGSPTTAEVSDATTTNPNGTTKTVAGTATRTSWPTGGGGGLTRGAPAKLPAVDLKSVDLVTALQTIFNRASQDYVIAVQDAPKASIDATLPGATLEQMLKSILNLIPGSPSLVYLQEDDIYIVTTARSDSTSDVTGGKVNLKLRKEEISSSLAALFAAVHVSYTLDESLQTDAGWVTASLQNVPFRTALETILDSTREPATFHVDRGIFHITAKK